MILDVLEPDERQRAALLETAERRVRYLEQRALTRAESNGVDAPPEQTQLVVASLWLEAAEAAAAVGRHGEAKAYLQRAVSYLVASGLPFGVALQRGLSIEADDLRQRGNRVLQGWKRRPEGKEEAPDVTPAGAWGARAYEAPQQWAYIALADAMRTAAEEDGARPFAIDPLMWGAVSVGRMRLPLDHYVFMAGFCSQAIHDRGDVDRGRVDGAVDVISKNLTALFRAAQWGRVNRYLWRQLLAPAPLFDFDAALLVGCILQVPGELRDTLEKRLQAREPDAEAAEHAVQFVGTVRQLL